MRVHYRLSMSYKSSNPLSVTAKDSPQRALQVLLLQKKVLRQSCSPPRSSPMSAWSRTKEIAQRLTPTAKRSISLTLALSTWKSADAKGATSANTTPAHAPAPPTTINAALMSGPSLPGRRGNSPINRVPNPNMQTDPSSIIAEIVAEPRPTACGENHLAATHQYPKPSTDVTAVVPINDPVLTNITILVLIHSNSIVPTVLNFFDFSNVFVPGCICCRSAGRFSVISNSSSRLAGGVFWSMI